jgi:putative methyltransferase (TIGR04325 family)
MRGLIGKPIAALRRRLRSLAPAVGGTRQQGDGATTLPAEQIDATPRADAATARPEWEYVPEGWTFARSEAEPLPRGWDVEHVALTYAEHWPAFRSAIAAPKPLGVAHEVAYGREMSNTSLVAHNTALTLAYVLARATRSADSLSVLDWGGGLGYQHAIAQSVLPEVQFDWHTRELPAVCREGRLASPAISFHESDDCLERSYDLVLASSSFQYAEDWRAHLGRLRRATRESLLLTRVPLVVSEPSFVVIQRAQPYGYETEYLGWVFNRTELLDEAAAAGLQLVREFFLQEPMDIAGAPEPPTHGAFLFRQVAP